MIPFLSKSLSNGPCKKESTCHKECRKVLTFAQLCYCSIILLIGSVSKNIYQNFMWLYIYLSLIDQLFSFQQNLPSLNTVEILCGEHKNIGSFCCLCLRLL